MKKFLALSLFGSSLLLCSNPAKADWDALGTKRIDNNDQITLEIYTIDTSSGQGTLRTSKFLGYKGGVAGFGLGGSFAVFRSVALLVP